MSKVVSALLRSPLSHTGPSFNDKSQDPAGPNGVLYVFFIDPVMKDADYSVANILAEGFPPAEVNSLYEKYRDAYTSGQNIVNLSVSSDFGK